MGFSLPWDKDKSRLEPEFEMDPNLLFEQAVEQEVESETEWIWRPLLILTLTLIFFALFATSLKSYFAWIDRPIEFIQVDGATRHLDKVGIQRELSQRVDSTLLSVDLQALQEVLIEDPWINEASIKRSWPPALEIELVEEVPVARWGDRGLLNHQGDIFWPDLKPEYENLPRLIGPSHETLRVMHQFHDLNSLFSRHGLHLESLELESRGAWNLKLDNGLKVIAGREDIMPRLRRFIQVYKTQLVEKIQQIEEIDIRYTHGIAVRWKTDESLAQQDTGLVQANSELKLTL